MPRLINTVARVNAEDQKHQVSVNYAYDYLAGGIGYLAYAPGELGGKPSRSEHGIDLSPVRAGLPWATGILACRQNKYWELTLDTTRVLLALFAADESAQDIMKSGKSIGEISRAELSGQMAEGWAKFPTYLFTDGDKQRTRLLAAVNVFIFVFDDFWEMHNIDSFTDVRNEFISRMQPGFSDAGESASLLQVVIDRIIHEIQDLDRASGNTAGQEMINLMVRFFLRPPPPEKYKDLEEFLLYRHEDAAVPYVLGCTKFASNSSVDLESPRLAKYLRLFKDHVSIANDLGSWRKEKDAYDAGKVLYIINAVDVVQKLFKLANESAAVAMTESLQLQIETEIDAEIERLLIEDTLTPDEWRFVDTTLHVMSGNVFVSTVMSRYGGEAYRLQ